jgi:hypothetical protein
VGGPGIVAGICTFTHTVCGSLHGAAAESKSTGGAIWMVETPGDASPGVASGLDDPHAANIVAAKTAVAECANENVNCFFMLLSPLPVVFIENYIAVRAAAYPY